MNIAHHVETGRRTQESGTALVFEDAHWSYGELDRLAGRTAHTLRALGVARGDRVALYLPNCPAWVWAYLGILKLGAIAVSIPASLRMDEVRALAMDADPVILVTTRELLAFVPRADLPGLRHCLLADADPADAAALPAASLDTVAAEEMAPEDPAVIVYTSGTTGRPRGVLLSHGNVVANARAKVRYLDIQPRDRLLLFLPLHHCFGQNAVLNAAFQAGATVLLQRRFDPERILAAAGAGEVTMFFGIPASYVLLLARATPADLRHVRYFFSAAAPLPVEVERRWVDRFGSVIHQGYGLTETSPFASYNHQSKHRQGSIGTPIEGVAMRVVDPDTGNEVPPGVPGEIVIRGHNIMLGYWRQPDETARAVRDGWFHSGDLGTRDEEGYFYLHDRLKDLVNVGGLKVYPAEVDAVLWTCPGVADAATYGVPDPVLGEQLRAAVVPEPGARPTPEHILRHCRAHLAAYKVPTTVVFRTAIPKNPTGKILRHVLRDETANRPGVDTASAMAVALRGREQGSDATRQWIAHWLAARLGTPLEPKDLRTSFFDLGVPSVAAVQLAQEIAQHFRVPLMPAALWSYPTIESLARHVVAETARAAAPSATAGEESTG